VRLRVKHIVVCRYAVVTSADPCSVELRIEWIIRSPDRLLAAKELVENATPATSLLFAPPKNTARLRFLVEKATELGAGTLQPVECAKGAAQAANVISHPLSQWAGEAAVQSERVSVPAVRATLPLVEAGLQACTEGRLLLICVEPRWAGTGLQPKLSPDAASAHCAAACG
jgi:16S rRNA U1498 N3-methylase RsmE